MAVSRFCTATFKGPIDSADGPLEAIVSTTFFNSPNSLNPGELLTGQACELLKSLSLEL